MPTLPGDLSIDLAGEAGCLQCGYYLRGEEGLRLAARLRQLEQGWPVAV